MTTCIQCGRAWSGPGLACPACRGEVPKEATVEAPAIERGTVKPTPHDRMNQTERRWHESHNLPRLASGEYLWCEHEALKFRVGVKRAWYCPDFPALRSDGVLEITEAKGRHIWDDGRAKFEAAAKQYPWIHWRLVQWKGGKWRTLADYPPVASQAGQAA